MTRRILAPRATANYTTRNSTAVLSTPDKRVTTRMKLMGDGSLVIEIYRNATGESYRRELSPALDWND